jgi:ribosomal protein S18 acetylase RimI-like enzyme
MINIKIKSKTDGNVVHYAAFIGDKIVSRLDVNMSDEDVACIWNFRTESEYRNKGIGSALLKYISKKHKPIMLFVSKINEEKLLTFYKKNDFHICGKSDSSRYYKMMYV